MLVWCNWQTQKAQTALNELMAEIGMEELANRAAMTNRVLVQWILNGKPAGRSYVDQLAALLD